MAETDLKKGLTNPLPVDLTDDCTRLLGQLCYAGSAIDPRAIRALTFLTDSINISGSTVDVTDRCNRLLGQLCHDCSPIDPRDRNWDLNFATDQADVSGSTITANAGINLNTSLLATEATLSEFNDKVIPQTEGGVIKLVVTDDETQNLLTQILKELKKNNIYLAKMTDEYVRNADIVND